MGNAEVQGQGLRPGEPTLSLLAVPLSSLILRSLADGPRDQIEIRCAVGSPAKSTLRSHLRCLEDAGLVVGRQRTPFPGALEFELLAAGVELQPVTAALERWLAEAPDGALQLGSEPARAAIKALVEGWATTMLRALAVEPLSLTELARLIHSVSYPSLERRLETMRMIRQLKVLPSESRGSPHEVTTWLRRGIAPLAAAAQWEARFGTADVPPIERLDVETAFLLATPLLSLPKDTSGKCELAVELGDGEKSTLGAVLVEVESGTVISCLPDPQANAPAARVYGSALNWLSAVIDDDFDALDVGGDMDLARAVVKGLHGALFGEQMVGSLASKS
jgi:DNA-binding HxlR family transcriptional regulator